MTYPRTPAPAKAHIKSITPTRLSSAHNLRRQVRSIGAQRFAITFTYNALDRAGIASLFAFGVAQRGQFNTFTLTVPGFEAPRGSWLGAPVVDGANQSGRTVNLRGMTPGATGKAGDFIKFNGHTKVYVLTADFAANGTGQAAASIEPALMATPADGEALIVNSVPFTVAMTSDLSEFDALPGWVVSHNVDMVEVF